MDYLQKIRSSVAAQVHGIAAQVSQALPGNPILREYTVGEQIGSAGPDLCWKIFKATKNTTKQEVAIWLFEKKQMDNWVRAKREELPEMLKRGVGQLTRLRHPRILTVERSLEESRDSFCFVTEPVFACLANCFGDLENVQPPNYLKDFELLDVERRYGLYQISEALAFLHNDTKIMHGNVSPSSIIINTKGAWKLGGFEFCVLGNTATPGKVTFELPSWSQNGISNLCPCMDYIAPELAESAHCDPSSDIFSLGVLSFATFARGKPLMESQNSFARHRDNLKKLKQSLPQLLSSIPESFREDLKMCLNETPELRPDAIQFGKLNYLDHQLLKILICLCDQRASMDNTQKMQFLKGLPNVLPQFPKRVQLQCIWSALASELANHLLIPFVLPNIFLIAENATANEFAASILPSLVTVFPIQTPYQINLLLLQRSDLLLAKMPPDQVKKHFLPLLYNSLTGDNSRIQELALSQVPNIVNFMDQEQMRTSLLPKLLRLMLESRDLTIRVQAIVCLAKLLPRNIEHWMVSDQILPALSKINSRDPGVLCAVLDIYRMVHESDKFGISKDQCARSVLPFLLNCCVEPTLNLKQFGQFMELIHKLMEKIETEQRQCLEQMSASQADQSRITDFAGILNAQPAVAAIDPKSTTNNGIGTSGETADWGDLAQMFGGSAKGEEMVAPANARGIGAVGGLSLEEKRRMAAEKEGGSRNGPASSAATAPEDEMDPFSGRQRQQNGVKRIPMGTGAFIPPPPSQLLHQQRPLTDHGQRTHQLGLDLLDLAEFLPTTSSSGGPAPLAQSASFAAFPSLPQPPSASFNPVQKPGQKRIGTPSPEDPFASLVMSAKGEGGGGTIGTFGQQPSREAGKRPDRDKVFEDLLS